jgi:hypothetical protein
MSDIPINPVTRRVQFTGNTGLGPFAFTFNIYVASDIAVYRNAVLLTLTTDYTVTIAANGTGSVTLTGSGSGTTLTLNDSLTIVGARQLARTTDFVTAGDLLAVALNEQLDSNVIMSQQLDEKIDRSIKFDQFDTYTTATLPAAAARASKILAFDVNGDIDVALASDFFGNGIIGANYVNNTATGTGSQTVFGLTVAPGSKNNVQVYIDGVYQNKASFSISGLSITFSEAPPLNSAIEFIIGQAVTEISGDSDSIDYTQGGTGSQQRTVTSKLQESVSVKDFGAVGDGVADDTAAIQAAIDACEVLKKPVFFPVGTYIITSGLTVQQKEVHVIGEGSESTILDFNLSSGVALDCGYAGGGTFWGWTIRDIQLKGNASGAETNLLKVNYPLNGNMERVKIDFANNVGVRLGRPQNFVMHSSEIRNSDGQGLIVENDFISGQGPQMFVLDNSTIKDNGTTDSAYQIAFLNGAEHVISNCIIEGSTSVANVFLGTDLCKITNCSFEGGTGLGSHIQIGSTTGPITASNCFIGHNNFNASDAGTQSIDAQSYRGIVISNNQFQSGGRITLGADEGNKYSIIDGNYGLDVFTDLTDSGTTDGKIIYRNSLAGGSTDTVQTITDGDTTPDVRGVNTLHTANTGATTITRFTGTASGDVFSVKVGDANTTIGNGTYIVTGTGADLTPSSGDLVTFVSVSGTATASVPVAYVIHS